MQLLSAFLIFNLLRMFNMLFWCTLQPKLQVCFDAFVTENAAEPKTEDICDIDLCRSSFNYNVLRSPGWINFNVNVLKYRSFPVSLRNENTFAISLHMTAGVWFYTICVYNFKRGSDRYCDVYPEVEKRCITRSNSYDFEQRLSDGGAFGKLYFFFISYVRCILPVW